MKSLIVRLSVLTLATTGFAASTVVSQTATKTDVIRPVVLGTVSPSPMCPMGDPTHCGMH